MMPASSLILHALVLLAGIVSYTVLTALGHDGNTVLEVALGYAGGAVGQSLTESVGAKGAPGP